MPRRTHSLMPAPPIYDLRTRYVTFFSAALGIFKSFYIYIPPDLGASQRAPALYFLRGHQQRKDTRGARAVAAPAFPSH